MADISKEELIELINRELNNPYPSDVFSWEIKEKMDITRGRFNEFIYRVVENTREKMIKLIEDT